MKLSINRCPEHRSYWCVTVDDEDSGYRITPTKCCGSWRVVKSWTLDKGDWLQAAKAMNEAAAKVKEPQKP